ncbi:MAG: hypothetical protein V2J51_16730 [Erythrobacter sp.]|jgi:hypothetical protein|nr:hypothetical protein [Erythrobacter sp.]
MSAKRAPTIVQRLSALARIRRYEALGALAQAIDEEQRRGALAQRTRALATHSRHAVNARTGIELGAAHGFGAALATIAEETARGAQSAAQITQHKASGLSRATKETRAVAERARQEQRAQAIAVERRDAIEETLARPLLNRFSQQETQAPARSRGGSRSTI